MDGNLVKVISAVRTDGEKHPSVVTAAESEWRAAGMEERLVRLTTERLSV